MRGNESDGVWEGDQAEDEGCWGCFGEDRWGRSGEGDNGDEDGGM